MAVVLGQRGGANYEKHTKEPCMLMVFVFHFHTVLPDVFDFEKILREKCKFSYRQAMRHCENYLPA